MTDLGASVAITSVVRPLRGGTSATGIAVEHQHIWSRLGRLERLCSRDAISLTRTR
ncbi:hypothetical protein [Curtobacterium sp. MCBD17_032]|uniref:hypothetical protein n=1 Tax=Curtobacterium sp. MCBD17_032 TaxID=2175659 RepID=UPI0015E8A27B|nr:hypothetical protein [Curtobacterium sp. MCBD17_032]